jgi:hypothetical protein
MNPLEKVGDAMARQAETGNDNLAWTAIQVRLST